MRRVAELLGQIVRGEVYTLTIFEVNYKMEPSGVFPMLGNARILQPASDLLM